MIGSIDVKEVQQEKKRHRRSIAATITSSSLAGAMESSNSYILAKASEEYASLEETELDNSIAVKDVSPEVTFSQPSTSDLLRPTHRNLTDISGLAETLDRYSVSDRAGAAIASAVLQDYGIIGKDKTENIIDRHKIRRARERKRQDLQTDALPFAIKGLYFDGRKDRTLIMEENRRKMIVEEHITMIEEPGSKYLGHFAPRSGSAESIVNKIWEFQEVFNVNLDSLEVIGCDGTNTNTGRKGGVIVLLELKIHKPLQWFICQLHANELPLRHLFQHLDGGTSGPRAFSGTIGKLLQNCEELPVAQFSRVDTSFPEFRSYDLSTDQKYLYDICQAVKNGVCPTELSKRDPGKLVHSRWLTTATRILRLYVASENPSENLKILTSFVMRVYAPMWFLIKAQSTCIHGAKNLYESIRSSDYLPQELKDIVYKTIQRNGYFGHPENILLGMLFDEQKVIRQLACQRILKSRQQGFSTERTFIIPPFNFDAKNYYELVDCQDTPWSEPPVTLSLSEDQLKQVVENPYHSALAHVAQYPCHTQAVERAVKTVTEAALAVCGGERRDGFIRSRIESRKNMPKFESKKDFYLK